MRRKWTNIEIKFLKENYNNIRIEEIAKKLGKTERAVEHKVYQFGLKEIIKKWTIEDINFLKENFYIMNILELSKKFKKSEKNIKRKAKQLGMSYKRKDSWTENEISILKEKYPTENVTEISKLLGRSPNAIGGKAINLGIKRSEESYKKHFNRKKKPIPQEKIDEVIEIALKYKTKLDFMNNDYIFYQKARRYKILNEVCKHMIPQKYSSPQLIMRYVLDTLFKIEGLYNDRKIIKPYEIDLYYEKYRLGFEFDGSIWHTKQKDKKKDKLCVCKNITLIRLKQHNDNFQCYFKDIKNDIISNLKFINIITNLNILKEDVINIEYNKDKIFSSIIDEKSIINTINKYTTLNDFHNSENKLYKFLHRIELLEKYTSHLYKEKCFKDYAEEDIINIVQKYTTIKEFRNENRLLYGLLYNHGLLEKYTSKLIRFKLNFSDDDIYAIVGKYDKFKDFRKNESQLYTYLRDKNLLEKYTSNLYKNNMKFDEYEIPNIVSKYDTYKDFRKNEQKLCHKLRRRGLLEKYTIHLKGK